MVDSEIWSPDEILDFQNRNWSKQLIWQNDKTRLNQNLADLVLLKKDNDYEYTDTI